MASRKVTAKKIEPAVDDQQLVDDNPNHEVELVEEIMDIDLDPAAYIYDGKVVVAVAAKLGGDVELTFDDETTIVVHHTEVVTDYNPFLSGGHGVSQIPCYLYE